METASHRALLALFGALALTTITMIGATYVTALNTTPTGQAIIFTPNKVMHPSGCDIATDRTVSTGRVSLMLETTSQPTLTSPVCLHFVVTNLNTTPFPVYKYLMEINVTDFIGKVVYHTAWGLTPPPNEQRFNLTTGHFWENGVHWYATQSGVMTTGTYHVTATLFLPGSSAATYRANPLVRVNLDINLQA